MFVLKLPQRPLSAVNTNARIVFSSRTASSGCADASVRAARSRSTRSASLAKGRAFTTRSCDLRRRDAAIIFIAFVICCVLFTARMRRRRSMSDGMPGLYAAAAAFLPAA